MIDVNLFSYHTKNTKEKQDPHDKWMQEIGSYFPADLEERLKNSGVMKRKRGVKSGMDFLKILLLYAVSNLSFRMLALSAAALSISTISDTAWRKKFLSSLPFLQALWNSLLSGLIEEAPASPPDSRSVYFVDASTIRQDGKQHAQYRIHMCYDFGHNHMSQVKLTDVHTAESLKHYHMQKGDIFLADAGYGTAANYAIAQEQNADVILRVSPNHFPIYHIDGTKIEIGALLKKAKKQEINSFEVTGFVKYQKRFYFVRLILGQIPEEKAQMARKRKKRRAQKDGCKIKSETLEFAGFVILATSLGIEYSKEEILSLYRSRWQVELLFKRIKQNFRIHTLRAASEKYAFTLIYLWLIVWLLTEKQVLKFEQALIKNKAKKERISQWDLCRFYFIRTVQLLELTWSLFVDPTDTLFLKRYLSTHSSRRQNQNSIFHLEVLPTLIS